MPFPYGFPLVFDWLPMVFPYGGHPLYVHAIPMGSPEGSPWIPMWSHRCFSMRCTCGVSLLPGWFPFPRFSAETVFLVASLVASAPGQCGGAQPGMPCLGKHIVSIPPGMVFALLHFPNERRCCVHAITIGFPVDCTYISTLGSLGALVMPIGFHVGSPLATHWAPWISIWGSIAMPMGPPCHSHMVPH